MLTILILGMIAIIGLIFGMVYLLGGDNDSASSAAASTRSAEDRGEM